MSDLVKLVTKAIREGFSPIPGISLGYLTTGQIDQVSEHILTVMAENKVILCVEQLRSITRKPLGSCGPLIMEVVDGEGDDIYEGNDDGTWGILETPGSNNFDQRAVPCEEIALPAVVLYIPNA